MDPKDQDPTVTPEPTPAAPTPAPAIPTAPIGLTAEQSQAFKAFLDAYMAPPTQKPSGVVIPGAPAIKKVTERGFKDDAVKSFMHWIRTGDDVAYKAAMQGQTDAEGGYLVPDDFYSQVVEKRNEIAVMRAAGAQVVPTSLDKLNVPVENTAATKFVVTAEEGSYDENEPTFDQAAIDVYKFTKLIKLSEELEADNKVNLQNYLARVFGRAMALAENYYMVNVAAAGSSMPTSVTYSATTTTAVASQTAFTAAELLDVIYAVPSAYSTNLVMFMRRSTLGKIRQLTGNPFSFIPTPTGGGGANTSQSAGTVHDIPVFVTDELPAQAAANKPVVVFNPEFYMIADREALVVSRNPWLYQATGQIGLFAKFRFGAELLIADAARVLVSKT
jgi:HK97 family phage major capsid protein